jgi:hypothetical protein
MKRTLAFMCAAALASSAFAIPDDIAFGEGPLSYVRPPSALVYDEGGGDVAMVVIAEKSVFEPMAAAILRPSLATPRVIAIVLGDGATGALSDEKVFTSLVGSILKCKGVSSACVVSCGSCAGFAACAAEALDTISSLVLLKGSVMPVVALKKPLFIASNFNEVKQLASGSARDLPARRRVLLYKEYLLEPR